LAEPSASAERERRALEVFERLADLDPEERRRRLATECGGDAELERLVRRLLEDDLVAETFLDRPLVLPQECFEETSFEGRRIGAYEIRERLGEGGTGVVYLAERAEGGFRHRVAIKLIRTHLGSRQAERRIRTERQILASLDHPNIARLLDGGTTEDGVPYVIMEAIDGCSLTEFCDRRSLGLHDRLRLFRTVCDSVHYAHSHLVVHRDLKPSNILVTADGVPKLLDFGIAKLLDASDGEERTRTEQRALTPAYASPEQLAGRAVTTASDVYSLGVLLYEVISGCRPYEVGTDAPEGLAERLERKPATSPSTAVEQAPEPAASELARLRSASRGELVRRLKGDLDQVVAKAMFADPPGRYGSAQQLSEDLERYLLGLPVIARAPRLGYRFRKLVGRHRWATVLGAVAAGLVCGFAGLAAVRSAELERERDLALAARARAEQQQRRSEAVTRFLQEAFAQADPSRARGAALTAREVLDSGTARLRRSLATEPALRATLLETLADVYVGLGEYDTALSLAAEAVDLHRQTASRPEDLARALEALGVARVHRQEFAAAEEALRESLAIRVAELGPSHPAVASVLFYLGDLHHWQGRPDRAEAAVRRALAIRRHQADVDPVALADGLYLLAEVTQGRRAPEEVETSYRQALELYRRGGPENVRGILLSLHGLGKALAAGGRADEAEEAYRQGERAGREVLGDHPLVADLLVSWATLLRGQGRWPEAEAKLRGAVAIYRTGGADGQLVNGLVHLGHLLLEKGDLEAAEPPLREALERARRSLAADDLRQGTLLNNLIVVLRRRGSVDEAAVLCEEAVPLRRRQMESTEASPDALRAGLAHTLVLCGDVLALRARFDEALPAAEEALATYREQGPPWRRAVAESVLGSALAGTGDRVRAQALLEAGHRALAELRPGTPYAAEAAQRLADFRRRAEGSGQPGAP
jgi:serine/threonine-protein kinase